MNNSKVIVVGSLNMDLVIHTPRFPKKGETVLGDELHYYFGGKGANQAVAASRQNVDTIMIGKVGSDRFGKDLILNLEEENINTEYIKIEDEQASGVALITINNQGENNIIVSAGANGSVKVEDVTILEQIATKRDIIVLQFEIPIDTAIAAIKSAKRVGAYIIVNPAPAQTLPNEIYPMIDLLIPNENEAQFLTEIEITNEESWRNAAEIILNKGVKEVIITLGTQGVFCLTKTEECLFPAHKVIAIDTVAAGDTFVGIIASQLAIGNSLKEAILWANAGAALTVTRSGAQASIPKKNEISTFLKNAKES